MPADVSALPPLAQQAIAAFGAGDFARAARLATEAMTVAPSPGLAMIRIDSERAAGNPSAALASARAAAEQFPQHERVALLLAQMLQDQGKLDEALAMMTRFATANASSAPAQLNLATLMLKSGDLASAEAKLRRALDLEPNYALALVNLSTVLLRQRRTDNALSVARRAVDIAPERTESQLALGEALIAAGRIEQALPALRAALAASPTNATAARKLREAAVAATPRWLFMNLADAAWQQALASAVGTRVRAGSTVLQIGDDGGMLALLAARAGAAAVHVSQPNPVLADSTRAVAALNGYSGEVKLIDRRVDGIELGRQLPGRADVLLVEPASPDFLAGGVLEMIEDAKRRLLKPNAKVLPGRVAIRGTLVGGDALQQRFFAGRVNGFDLSPLNSLASVRAAIEHGTVPLVEMSDRVDFFQFDLQAASSFPEQRRSIEARARMDGNVLGILQWLWVELAAGLACENAPETRGSHWAMVFHAFPRPVAVKRGQGLRLAVRQDRTSFSVDLEH